jgi:transposase
MGIQPFKKELLKKRVIELYQAGHTFREVSKQLGISHETVRQMWLSTTIGDTALTQIDTPSSVIGRGSLDP